MRYINTLREGETIRTIYLCKGKRSAETRNGKPYDNLTLQDKTGTIDAKIWEPNNAGIDDFDALDYIEVYGDVSSFQGALQVSIKRIRRCREGEFNPADYTINARQGFVYTLEEDGLRFDTYVVAAGKYLGKVVGKMALSGQAYVLKNMDFYAYAEEDYADIGGDSIIHGVTLEEAECERIQITGDLGEKLLIPVRQD